MKKLFFLALLSLISLTQGAFAVCNTDTDSFDTNGWCIDKFGSFTPKTMVSAGTQVATQGGYRVPILNVTNVPSVQTTFDSLSSQQSGSIIVDTGGFAITVVTMDSLLGSGGHYILPQAAAGLQFSFTSASKSTITVSTLNALQGNTTSGGDTIEYSPGGAALVAGNGVKSSGAAGDTVTLVSPAAGMWVITAMSAHAQSATVDTAWIAATTQ